MNDVEEHVRCASNDRNRLERELDHFLSCHPKELSIAVTVPVGHNAIVRRNNRREFIHDTLMGAILGPHAVKSPYTPVMMLRRTTEVCRPLSTLHSYSKSASHCYGQIHIW